MTDIENITINGVTVRKYRDAEKWSIGVDGSASQIHGLSDTEIHGLLACLGLMGFDLRPYTTQQTIDAVGECPQ